MQQTNNKKRYTLNLNPLLARKPQRNSKTEITKQIFFSNKRQRDSSKQENPAFLSQNTKESTKTREKSHKHHVTLNEFPKVLFNENSMKFRNNKSLENYEKIQPFTTRPKTFLENRHQNTILFTRKNEKKHEENTILSTRNNEKFKEKITDFKDFLTPREKTSNLMIKEQNSREILENFSNLTRINNNLFKKHMKIINNHEKKRLNLKNESEFRKTYDFKEEKERNYSVISGFITQRSQEDDTLMAIDVEKTKNDVLLGKFTFRYFFLKIRNRESPLKVGN